MSFVNYKVVMFYKAGPGLRKFVQNILHKFFSLDTSFPVSSIEPFLSTNSFYNLIFLLGSNEALFWRHDTQHNDIQHNDKQHNDIQPNDALNQNHLMLGVI